MATTSLVSTVSSVAVNKTEPDIASTSESAVIDASTRLVEVKLEMAPAAATAPLMAPEAPKATPTPTPSASTKPVESAVSDTLPVVAVASEPLITARVVVPKFISAIDKAKDTSSDTAPAPPIETETATRVESIAELSVAFRVTAVVSTTDPAVIAASTVLISVLRASAADPATLTETPPAPPVLTPAATPTTSTVVFAKAVTSTVPVSASTSDASMAARVVPPILFSETEAAMVTLTEAAPAPPADKEAEVMIAWMLDRSCASTQTLPAELTVLPVILASTKLVVAFLAKTTLAETLTDTPPAPPAATPTAWPNALMAVSAKASTVTAPVVLTVESPMVASNVLPIMFSAAVADTAMLTDTAPAPPADSDAASSSANMLD